MASIQSCEICEALEDRQAARAAERAPRRCPSAVKLRPKFGDCDDALEAARGREADVVEIDAGGAVRGVRFPGPVAEAEIAAQAR